MTSRRQVERAIEQHADQLSAYPNVVGIGMGALAVAVYVTEKKPASELAEDEMLPGFVEVDGQSGTVKVPVKVIEMGEVGPQAGAGDDTENRRNDDDDGSTFSAQ